MTPYRPRRQLNTTDADACLATHPLWGITRALLQGRDVHDLPALVALGYPAAAADALAYS